MSTWGALWQQPSEGSSTAAQARGLNSRVCWARRAVWIGVGIPLSLVSLALQNVTLASQDYGAVLLVALTLTIVADCCYAVAFVQGGLATRCASVFLMLPTLFVVGDFARRAPYTFRWASAMQFHAG